MRYASLAELKAAIAGGDVRVVDGAWQETPVTPVTAAPLEADEGRAFVAWRDAMRSQWPELATLYHVPNGGARSKASAGKLRAEGVVAGVPDYHWPLSRRGYHGLWIELKRQRGGTVRAEQHAFAEALRSQGHCVRVCRGAAEAIATCEWYYGE